MTPIRDLALCCALVAAHATHAVAQGGVRPLPILDVPYISQSEALCGGAAAAMVLRYWGARDVFAESFEDLVEPDGVGIRTDRLIGDLRQRGWTAVESSGDAGAIAHEMGQGRPVIALIEDRPSAFHYVVVVAWHERGVVLHDPARAPFLVMSVQEFLRRWQAARRWMAVVVPGEAPRVSDGGRLADASAAPATASSDEDCDDLVHRGVRYAQADDLGSAERTLAAAVGCPAAVRELAGVRVLQKRWSEAADLAAAAVAADDRDTYAWRVLATSRFVQDDRLGALAAWNQAGEPRLDVLQIDGLSRTRHAVVERLLDTAPGDLLTVERFVRARRRLAELPSASFAHLDYRPAPGGIAELRGSVAERSLVPAGRIWLLATALSTAATRELRVSSGSLVGGGESVSAQWRFWPHRPRIAVGLRAPAPWAGVWSIDGFSERQPFTIDGIRPAERVGARLVSSDWATGWLRWSALGGVDRWANEPARAMAGGALRMVSTDERLSGHADAALWSGRGAFATVDAGLRARTSATRSGLVVIATGGAQLATARAPLDVWWGGDTGHARPVLLRSHPVLDRGRLKVDRLGRSLVHGSVEARRWRRTTLLGSAAAAAFADFGRTTRRREGATLHDLDLGVGARLSVTGVSGVFRFDVAKGLRDGSTAVSVSYEP